MKSAEEWLEVSKQIALELMKLPKIDAINQAVDNKFAIKLFKQIQLDAYKAGVGDADLNARESKTLEEAIKRITFARDKKESL